MVADICAIEFGLLGQQPADDAADLRARHACAGGRAERILREERRASAASDNARGEPARPQAKPATRRKASVTASRAIHHDLVGEHRAVIASCRRS